VKRSYIQKWSSKRPPHFVIVGRLSPGKGLSRLINISNAIGEKARFTSVGGGFDAMRLFSSPNIDVILSYTHEELPDLLKSIRPTATLFLSQVPETWNYVLSEMRCLGLPVIAPNSGSFAERITHGKNGLLYEQTDESLIALLTKVIDGSIACVPPETKPAEPSISQANRAYNKYVRAEKPQLLIRNFPSQPYRLRSLNQEQECQAKINQKRSEIQNKWLHRSIQNKVDQLERLDRTVKQRTNWALDLKVGLEEKTQWALGLEKDVKRLNRTIKQLQTELADRTQWAQRLDQQLTERTEWALGLEKSVEQLKQEITEKTQHSLEQALEIDALSKLLVTTKEEKNRSKLEHQQTHRQLLETQQQYANLQKEMGILLNSRSWKITRPLRVLVRVLLALHYRRSWDPRNWLRQSKRFIRAIKTHGWRTSLQALQYHRPIENQPSVPIESLSHLEINGTPSLVDFRPSGKDLGEVKFSIIIPVFKQRAVLRL